MSDKHLGYASLQLVPTNTNVKEEQYVSQSIFWLENGRKNSSLGAIWFFIMPLTHQTSTLKRIISEEIDCVEEGVALARAH